MKSDIQIVIADDHAIFRRGLRSMIVSEPDLKILAEAIDGRSALAAIAEHEPDVAVLDVDMPEMDGFAVGRAVREKDLAVGIIFLTMHNTAALLKAALEVGAQGFVLKDGALTEIIDCIRAVAAGKKYISPQMAGLLFEIGRSDQTTKRKSSPLEQLTTSEIRILRLIANQKTSRDIAETLFISIRTVDRHRSNICEKLGVRGTNGLVKFALANSSDLTE